mmetsp:Transcript_4674/g.13544  ORF Transcript_4674/g.13544 Transcript_4674/m.13544 type:complete len:388 (+) Transcript_4674:331-1494(+)
MVQLESAWCLEFTPPILLEESGERPGFEPFELCHHPLERVSTVSRLHHLVRGRAPAEYGVLVFEAGNALLRAGAAAHQPKVAEVRTGDARQADLACLQRVGHGMPHPQAMGHPLRVCVRAVQSGGDAGCPTSLAQGDLSVDHARERLCELPGRAQGKLGAWLRRHASLGQLPGEALEGEDRGSGHAPRRGHGFEAPGQPVRGGEVDGLGHVEAVAQARVVRAWEGEDEVSLVLRARVHGYALSCQLCRSHHGHQLVEKVGGPVEKRGHELARRALEGVRCVRGHPVPRLGRAAPEHVDRIEPEVLHMPGEAAKLHTHIQPGGGHARDARAHVGKQRGARPGGQGGEVPARAPLEGPRRVRGRVQVSAIEDATWRLARGDGPPKGSLA